MKCLSNVLYATEIFLHTLKHLLDKIPISRVKAGFYLAYHKFSHTGTQVNNFIFALGFCKSMFKKFSVVCSKGQAKFGIKYEIERKCLITSFK